MIADQPFYDDGEGDGDAPGGFGKHDMKKMSDKELFEMIGNINK